MTDIIETRTGPVAQMLENGVVIATATKVDGKWRAKRVRKPGETWDTTSEACTLNSAWRQLLGVVPA